MHDVKLNHDYNPLELLYNPLDFTSYEYILNLILRKRICPAYQLFRIPLKNDIIMGNKECVKIYDFLMHDKFN